MKSIVMKLGDRELCTVVGDSTNPHIWHLEDVKIDISHPHSPNLREWFDACFYSLPCETFDERYEFVKADAYFCYLKPTLKLVVKEE